MFHDRRPRHGVVLLSALMVAGLFAWAPAATVASPATPIRYAYDADGRLSAVIDPAAGSARYTYDATGNATSITRGTASAVAIIEFAPDSGPVGTAVAIDGTGFSTMASQNTVRFEGGLERVYDWYSEWRNR